jgi:hypothetical protein
MMSNSLRFAAPLVVLALLVCPPRMLRADQVYKSVDSEGHVVYSDRLDPSTTQSIVQIDDARTPPDVIHFCWTNCFTLSFENGLYRRTDGTDETWTVERFTSRSVILHRHGVPAAWNGFSADVVYQGQVANDQLINVTVNGGAVSDISAAWGAALDTLPGSNAERDQRSSGQLKAPGVEPPAPPPGAPPSADPADLEVRTADAPPPLLNYEQPPCAGDGYLWTPGFWAWNGAGYYWVPGAWVQPPRAGVLWTPGYWGFVGAFYVFHPGYWGPHIGFYGGINYGYGYGGAGFAGGRWVGNSFAYNRAVSNVDASLIHNTYNETVIHSTVNKVSYNGGQSGTTAAATPQERAAAAEPHFSPTPRQHQIVEQSRANPALMAQTSRSNHAAVALTHAPMSNSPHTAGTHVTTTPAIAGQPSDGGRPHATQAAPIATPHTPRAAAQPTPSVAPKPAAVAPVKPAPHPKKG